jgi:transcriptional regulator with XRE-family HTH domain
MCREPTMRTHSSTVVASTTVKRPPSVIPGAGRLVRAWREKRKLSQLELALEAGVSARHLSFVETGRSTPSREMILRLSQSLDIPLRERNALLIAAGHAPHYSENRLAAPEMDGVRRAIDRLLSAHEPYPGVAVDRYWNVELANPAAQRMMAPLPEFLRVPRVNMFRAGLHPDGFAAITTNFVEWGAYLLGEVERVAAATLDGSADKLLEEIRGYSTVHALRRAGPELTPEQRLLVRCEVSVGGATLSLFTTLVTFGSPRDVTLSELTVELFWPADAATAAAFQAAAGSAPT